MPDPDQPPHFAIRNATHDAAVLAIAYVLAIADDIAVADDIAIDDDNDSDNGERGRGPARDP